MKKIVILLLSVTSIFAVAETYQFKTPISPVIEESVFTSSTPTVAGLVETGPRGTISLRGTNGLTSSSYLSKTDFMNSTAERAFNGLDTNKTVINSEYDVLDSDGYWLSGSYSFNQWIQVDFGQDVNIARFAILKISSSGNLPRDTIVQTSNDGVNWANHQEAAFLEVLGWQTVTLDDPIITRFFRLHILNNHGADRVQIDELEIYQN
jgi:hypothetical protein